MNSVHTPRRWILKDPQKPPLRGLLPPLIALSAAAVAIWLMAPWLWAFRAPAFGVGPALLAAAYIALLLIIAFATGALTLSAVGPQSAPPYKSPTPALSRRLAIGALWLAPLPLSGGSGSLITPPLSTAAAIAVATCFRDFYLPPRKRGPRATLLPLLVLAAALLQTAGVAVVLHETLYASVFCAAGLLAIMWATTSNKGREIRGASVPRFLAHALVVLIVTGSILNIFSPTLKGTGSSTPVQNAEPAGKSSTRLYSGVILRPPAKRITTLVPPPKLHLATVPAAAIPPSVIPFSGEYWFFYTWSRLVNGRREYGRSRPPENSMVQASDPITWTMTAVERRISLVMKAHQPLQPALDARCCQRIDVTLNIADAAPETMSMELLLIDSFGGRKGVHSLGEVAVPSGSARAVVPFPVSTSGSFDAIEVMFHLAPERHNQSGNIAIDSFHLIGR